MDGDGASGPRHEPFEELAVAITVTVGEGDFDVRRRWNLIRK
jgi:hypothetical protein